MNYICHPYLQACHMHTSVPSARGGAGRGDEPLNVAALLSQEGLPQAAAATVVLSHRSSRLSCSTSTACATKGRFTSLSLKWGVPLRGDCVGTRLTPSTCWTESVTALREAQILTLRLQGRLQRCVNFLK